METATKITSQLRLERLFLARCQTDMTPPQLATHLSAAQTECLFRSSVIDRKEMSFGWPGPLQFRQVTIPLRIVSILYCHFCSRSVSTFGPAAYISFEKDSMARPRTAYLGALRRLSAEEFRIKLCDCKQFFFDDKCRLCSLDGRRCQKDATIDVTARAVPSKQQWKHGF